MRPFILLLLLVIFILPSLSYATEAAYEQHIAKGVLYIEVDNYKEAIAEFKRALKEKPDDHVATLYLGIALSRAGDKEAEATLRKAFLMNPGEPRVNLELGIYYFNKAIYDEAIDYFENTIELAPNTDFSVKAKEYIKVINDIKGRAAVKRWALNISAGTQYDSNVVLDTEGNPLPPGISEKSDWRAVLYLKGRYNILTRERAEGSVGYSFYQSLHAELSDFNIT